MIQESWDEKSMVEAAQKGSLDAFNALILHYQTRVYNLARYILHDDAAADDAAQEAFIAAYRALASFKGGSFRAWLLRIVTNQCYDALLRYKRRATISWDDFGDMEEEANPHLVDESPSPERQYQNSELREILDRGLSVLPEEQRMVIVLVDQMGCAYEEVMQITHMPLGTVKSRLHRARIRMREYLSGKMEHLPSRYRPEEKRTIKVIKQPPLARAKPGGRHIFACR